MIMLIPRHPNRYAAQRAPVIAPALARRPLPGAQISEAALADRQTASMRCRGARGLQGENHRLPAAYAVDRSPVGNSARPARRLSPAERR